MLDALPVLPVPLVEIGLPLMIKLLREIDVHQAAHAVGEPPDRELLQPRIIGAEEIDIVRTDTEIIGREQVLGPDTIFQVG